jgi:hypothetical protein
MSPFLTTLGGGSVRGFGRGRRITAAVVVPAGVPTITSVGTISYNGSGDSFSVSSVTVSNPSSATSGPYQLQFEIVDQNSGGQVSFSGSSSTVNPNLTVYAQCSYKQIRARYYNYNTGQYYDWSAPYQIYVPVAPAGYPYSSGCSGCEQVVRETNGQCYGYNTISSYSDVPNCCPGGGVIYISGGSIDIVFYQSTYVYYSVVDITNWEDGFTYSALTYHNNYFTSLNLYSGGWGVLGSVSMNAGVSSPTAPNAGVGLGFGGDSYTHYFY